MSDPNKASQRKQMEASAAASRAVMVYGCDSLGQPDSHLGTTMANIARKVAGIAGIGYAGAYDEAAPGRPRPYLVPAQTLVGQDLAARLGVQGKGDLFGGVVPYAFVATKAITHGLVEPGAAAPEGWSEAFVQRVVGATLPGFTAFTLADARTAGTRLLALGPVRLKEPCGIGGLGQCVVASARALDEALAAMPDAVVEAHGIVVERDLDAPQTYSVGQVELAGLRASYCGTQGLTQNNRGQQVYGGSTLTVVRGGFDTLLHQPFDARTLAAVRAAMVYHDAALACYGGMVLTRCNYDVAFGPAAGPGADREQVLGGVLEQSWRVGGATGAELAALEALRNDPDRVRVVASTREVYGANVRIPADAVIYFQGEDRHVGPLTKYARLEPDSHGNP
ncbi:DUF3182 family protein [Cupriavidus consociatus]|uniref:DUF3182 family protein n=1 Tax=Cupriavidus consociatus TaxID=2821357 RepID=UPI001AEB5FC3|nr:DUF3182 family protein [Cupriavidus sp. LEh21]MBP0619874.1 DUF3182 family protein [Cupriavidus sp. LEh25]MDK2656528.1 DUF3182 family protein [Cupriavidus sp. LEh21]